MPGPTQKNLLFSTREAMHHIRAVSGSPLISCACYVANMPLVHEIYLRYLQKNLNNFSVILYVFVAHLLRDLAEVRPLVVWALDLQDRRR